MTFSQSFIRSGLVAILLATSACEGSIYALRNAEATASRNIANFSDQVNPQPQQLRRPTEPRYCYVMMGDTVCYRDPLPGADTRLVGYQEPLAPVDGHQIVAAPTRNVRNELPVAEVGSITPAAQGRVSSDASFSNGGSTTSSSVDVSAPPPVQGNLEPLPLN